MILLKILGSLVAFALMALSLISLFGAFIQGCAANPGDYGHGWGIFIGVILGAAGLGLLQAIWHKGN